MNDRYRSFVRHAYNEMKSIMETMREAKDAINVDAINVEMRVEVAVLLAPTITQSQMGGVH